MPPLIRRRPLLERIKSYLDPYDFLLWLSEELNDDTYDELLNTWATPIGLVLNLVFILARGGSRIGSPAGGDDVFGEASSGRSWLAWLVSLYVNSKEYADGRSQFTFIVHSLTILCLLNTFYTFLRKRHYRLFELPISRFLLACLKWVESDVIGSAEPGVI